LTHSMVLSPFSAEKLASTIRSRPNPRGTAEGNRKKEKGGEKEKKGGETFFLLYLLERNGSADRDSSSPRVLDVEEKGKKKKKRKMEKNENTGNIHSPFFSQVRDDCF